MQQLFSRRDGWWGLKSVKYETDNWSNSYPIIIWVLYFVNSVDSVISNCQKIKKSWCFRNWNDIVVDKVMLHDLQAVQLHGQS
jgi:hypothetical protein